MDAVPGSADHTRLRGLVAKAFTPRVIERVRPRIHEVVDELIDHIPGAIEELLRFDSPVQLVRRWAREQVEVGGAEMAAGDEVVLLIGAANRDPDQFPSPDVLDVGRTNVRNLSFGGGPHFCLGAGLARMEAQIAITTLFRRLRRLELTGETPEWRDHVVLRGFRSLPIRFAR